MPAVTRGFAIGRDAMVAAANKAGSGDAATRIDRRPTRDDGTQKPKDEGSGTISRIVPAAARAGGTAIAISDSARPMAMGEGSGRHDTIATVWPVPEPARGGHRDTIANPQPMPEPVQPGRRETGAAVQPMAEPTRLDTGRRDWPVTGPSAATASRIRMASATDGAPAAPPALQTTQAAPDTALRSLTGDLAHGSQERSARFLSALSALPVGESGSQAMIASLESVTASRGVSAPFEAGTGQAQEAGRAAGRALVDQILPAVQRRTGGRVELTLSPAELGRVEITMQSRDGGMSVSLNAERPETLELLRRHIDLLAADMRQLGMTDLSFSFGREPAGDPSPGEGEGEGQGSNDGEAGARPGDRHAAPAVGDATPPWQPGETRRMDLRL